MTATQLVGALAAVSLSALLVGAVTQDTTLLYGGVRGLSVLAPVLVVYVAAGAIERRAGR